MADPSDYYEVLGVDPATASQDEIDDAYRKLIKEVHPDTGDNPDRDRLQLVKRVGDVLRDPDERELYTRLGHEQYVNRAGRSEHSYSGDIFSRPARGQGRANVPSGSRGRGQDSLSTRDEPDPDDLDDDFEFLEDSKSKAAHEQTDEIDAKSGAYDILEDDSEDPVNSASHVADMHTKTWMTRAGILALTLAVTGGFLVGVRVGVAPLTDIAGDVSIGTLSSLLYVLTLTVAVATVAVSESRRRNSLYLGSDDASRVRGRISISGVLFALAAIAYSVYYSVSDFPAIGGQPPAGYISNAHAWAYAREWINHVVGGGEAVSLLHLMAAGAFLFCGVIGGGVLLFGVSRQVWTQRYIQGQSVLPSLWIVPAVALCVTVLWEALFSIGLDLGLNGIVPGDLGATCLICLLGLYVFTWMR